MPVPPHGSRLTRKELFRVFSGAILFLSFWIGLRLLEPQPSCGGGGRTSFGGAPDQQGGQPLSKITLISVLVASVLAWFIHLA
jgi:hypothetical protein